MFSNSTVWPWKYVTKQRGLKPNLLLGHTISAFTSLCTSCGPEYFLHKIKVHENKEKVSTSKAVFSLRGYIQKLLLGVLELITTFKKKPSKAPAVPSTC